MNRVFKFSWQ